MSRGSSSNDTLSIEIRSNASNLGPRINFMSSIRLRNHAERLLEQGMGMRAVARLLGCSYKGVHYNHARRLQTNSLRNRNRGRRIFAEIHSNKIICNELIRRPTSTANDIYGSLRRAGYSLTLRQVRIRIEALEYKWRRVRRCQVISDLNRQARLDLRSWVLDTDYFFDSHIFVDETTVVLGRKQNYAYVKKGQLPPTVGQLTHGDGYHVFAGISYRGATRIVVWDKKQRMNSQFYCNQLVKHIAKAGQQLYQGNYFLVQDNHRAHTSQYTREFMDELEIKRFLWPAQSPDWNPIEFCWRDMKDYISKISPRSKADLLRTIFDFFKNSVTPAYCRKLIRYGYRNMERSVDGLNHEGEKPKRHVYHY